MFHLPALSGSMLVLLGALCWSLNSPLVKYLPLDPFLICSLRSVIAGVVLLPLLRPKKSTGTGGSSVTASVIVAYVSASSWPYPAHRQPSVLVCNIQLQFGYSCCSGNRPAISTAGPSCPCW